jgi:hypothetical protein
MSSTILAIDLGKFNSVFCWFNPDSHADRFRTASFVAINLFLLVDSGARWLIPARGFADETTNLHQFSRCSDLNCRTIQPAAAMQSTPSSRATGPRALYQYVSRTSPRAAALQPKKMENTATAQTASSRAARRPPSTP